jgi:ketosteroid isomerase-like protein
MKQGREVATQPEDLSRLFLERANLGNVDGVVALYEAHAVLANPPAQAMTGIGAIRQFYERLLQGKPTFRGNTKTALRHGDLALTSTEFSISTPGPNGQPMVMRSATAEIARRQPDGTWLWVVDQPNILS